MVKRVELFARCWGRRPSSVDESRDVVVETRISITLQLHYRYRYPAHRFIRVLLSKPPSVSMRCSPCYRWERGDLRRETLIPMVTQQGL